VPPGDAWHHDRPGRPVRRGPAGARFRTSWVPRRRAEPAAPGAAAAADAGCRWRIENAFKYLSAHHGIDWLCDYTAKLIDDDRIVDNPARKSARKAVKAAEASLADAERRLAQLLASAQSAAQKNKAIPAAQDTITRAQQAVVAARTARDAIPAKIAVNQAHPGAQRACCTPAAGPADGAAAAGRQRRTVASRAAERLPARPRRVAGHHPPPAPPARTHRLPPRRDHRHRRAARQHPHRPGTGLPDRGAQRHPAADARRPPAHHLPPRR